MQNLNNFYRKITQFFLNLFAESFSNGVLLRDPSPGGTIGGQMNPDNCVLQFELTLVQLKKVNYKQLLFIFALWLNKCVWAVFIED